ncbi:MAG: hypothetical protein MJZ20_12550 [Bacteroidaceae bacterium]|nr:hypothetical protein [Bacteroidaceae bacterium]
MALTFFENFIDNVAQAPADRELDAVNAYVDSQWHDSTLWHKVEQETYIGSFKFECIEVWLNTVSDFTNNIIKNASDFRRLMFKDNRTEVERGRYYKFHKNYWLVYEDTTEEHPYAEVLVRRCNNVAKWIDYETGRIIEQPCVLEYDLSATNPKVDKDIITQNSSLTLVLQGNEYTHRLKPNQRFIFNGVAYKYIAINNYMQNNYVDEGVHLLWLDIDRDIEKPTDDLINNIADRFEYNFVVDIQGAPIERTDGFSGQLVANVMLNGEKIDKSVVWSSNKFATIDQDGNYTLKGDAGDVAQITATFGSFSHTVNIDIVDFVVAQTDLIMSPFVNFVREGETAEFDVWLYTNGIKQEDVPTYTVSGAPSGNYILTQNDNHFTLTNLRCSGKPLDIVFSADGGTLEHSIRLTALY